MNDVRAVDRTARHFLVDYSLPLAATKIANVAAWLPGSAASQWVRGQWQQENRQRGQKKQNRPRIYGYDSLPPDEVVANIQSELQRCGYYYDAVDGILGPRTQEALIRYQRDHGLPVTGGIDQETVAALGLG
jgi:peptidoglycan hydrolase-like protein with peptidoglycan-binding domain